MISDTDSPLAGPPPLPRLASWEHSPKVLCYESLPYLDHRLGARVRFFGAPSAHHWLAEGVWDGEPCHLLRLDGEPSPADATLMMNFLQDLPGLARVQCVVPPARESMLRGVLARLIHYARLPVAIHICA